MVLDEINVALSLDLLKIGDVLAAIQDYPANRILVLTGRGAPPELVAAADLVTEMKELKHPFGQGERAKFTVEY